MTYSITDKCIGCGLCEKNCPVKAISGSIKQRHSIDAGRCVSCGLCGRLCAVDAVLMPDGSVAQKTPKAQWKHPAVDTAACSGCSMCVESCPEYCLRLSGPAKRGDTHTFAMLAEPEKCIGCGICQRACPIEAIKLV